MITGTPALVAAVAALVSASMPTGVDDDPPDSSAFDPGDAPLEIVEGEPLDMRLPDADVRPITYDSPGGPVTGFISYPPDGPSEAGIIAMHGMPESARSMTELPLAVMGCFGATAIAIDAPYVRAERFSTPLTFDETDRDETIQLVVDLRRAVDVLESLGIERITYDGVSWSSDAGVVLAGVEPRIDGFAIMVGSLVVDRFVRDGAAIGPLAEQSAADAERWIEMMSAVSALEFVADATAPIVFRNHRDDTIATADSAERLQEAGGPGFEIVWYDDSPDPAGHEVSLSMIVDHVRWQADVLGLDPARVDGCLAPVVGHVPERPATSSP